MYSHIPINAPKFEFKDCFNITILFVIGFCFFNFIIYKPEFPSPEEILVGSNINAIFSQEFSIDSNPPLPFLIYHFCLYLYGGLGKISFYSTKDPYNVMAYIVLRRISATIASFSSPLLYLSCRFNNIKISWAFIATFLFCLQPSFIASFRFIGISSFKIFFLSLIIALFSYFRTKKNFKYIHFLIIGATIAFGTLCSYSLFFTFIPFLFLGFHKKAGKTILPLTLSFGMFFLVFINIYQYFLSTFHTVGPFCDSINSTICQPLLIGESLNFFKSFLPILNFQHLLNLKTHISDVFFLRWPFATGKTILYQDIDDPKITIFYSSSNLLSFVIFSCIILFIFFLSKSKEAICNSWLLLFYFILYLVQIINKPFNDLSAYFQPFFVSIIIFANSMQLLEDKLCRIQKSVKYHKLLRNRILLSVFLKGMILFLIIITNIRSYFSIYGL